MINCICWCKLIVIPSFLNLSSNVPCHGVLVSDTTHIWQWPQKVIMGLKNVCQWHLSSDATGQGMTDTCAQCRRWKWTSRGASHIKVENGQFPRLVLCHVDSDEVYAGAPCDVPTMAKSPSCAFLGTFSCHRVPLSDCISGHIPTASLALVLLRQRTSASFLVLHS